ncbi:hypothetical protein F5Y11DRAFT_316266 [Daldinia sp. FL1419]|nr:hypothetical protein F5Y11DRAFT_316266 [Daldinia sp. FL1419]
MQKTEGYAISFFFLLAILSDENYLFSEPENMLLLIVVPTPEYPIVAIFRGHMSPILPITSAAVVLDGGEYSTVST